MSVNFCGIELAHPVVNSSGTFDPLAARRAFGDAAFTNFPFSAHVTKTITVAARQGNRPPRLWEAPTSLINSIGLPNKGIERWLAEDYPQLRELPVPLIVNVMGFDTDELIQLVGAVAQLADVVAIELNVSCPNVETGTIIGSDPDECSRTVNAVRGLTTLPLIVKLTPNATDPAAVALAAQEAGADAISMINTLRGLALDPTTLEPWLGGGTGGVSGPAVKAVALAQTASVCAAVSIPIIGMGGIDSGHAAREFLAAGATLVAVGTASFTDPTAGSRISAELGAMTAH
ncbi:MAG: dihydroorotate dehydrogenase [Solirubrobacterales bacterium]|nr:dihydroorotate dehydrogenase [Solirubrobacterales bacterium]